MADENNLDLDEIDAIEEETPNEALDLDVEGTDTPTSARDLEAVYDLSLIHI